MEFVKARLLADVGHSGREKDLEIKDILDVFKDCELTPSKKTNSPETKHPLLTLGKDKIFLGGLMYIGLVMPGYG